MTNDDAFSLRVDRAGGSLGLKSHDVGYAADGEHDELLGGLKSHDFSYNVEGDREKVGMMSHDAEINAVRLKSHDFSYNVEGDREKVGMMSHVGEINAVRLKSHDFSYGRLVGTSHTGMRNSLADRSCGVRTGIFRWRFAKSSPASWKTLSRRSQIVGEMRVVIRRIFEHNPGKSCEFLLSRGG
jgi:hypothetical protein